MDTMIFIMAAIIVVLLLAVRALFLQRSDLRRELTWSRQEAERWREEAVKRGWKNPFEECLDSLNDGLGKLQTAAEAMRRAAETQKLNTAKLREINHSLDGTNASLRRQNAALEKAAVHFDRAASTLAAPRPAPAPLPAVRPPEEDPLARAAIERAEAELASGRHETDPKKLN